MKKNYKILERDFRPLSNGSWRNHIVVDDKSIQVLLRIEQTMRQLEIMGDDEQRSLWVEVKMPKRVNETFEPSPAGLTRNKWYRVTTAQYRECHYLYISDAQWNMTILQSADNAYTNQRSWQYDLEAPLLSLEKVINKIVASVLEDGSHYNEYVASHLPYRYRHGRIRRDALYAIYPDNRLKDRELYLSILHELKDKTPTTFEKMNLNTYMHVWRMAYEAYEKCNEWLSKNEDDFSKLTDAEMFKRYSSKGHEIEGLDYDSEGDFIKWERENSSYHNLDVAYARIHLWPHKREDSKWELYISFGVYGYYDDVLFITRSLYEQGVYLVVSEQDELMSILREDDYVGIVPNPDKYMNRNGVTNQVMLPYLGEEDLSTVETLIAQTDWQPTAVVRPKSHIN